MELEKIREEKIVRLGGLQQKYFSCVRRLRAFAWGHGPLLDHLPFEKQYRVGDSMDVAFRRFMDRDAIPLAKLNADSFPSYRVRQAFTPVVPSAELIDRTIWFARLRDCHVVTSSEGIILGSVGFTCYDKRRAEITTLSVDKDFRGLGLGKLLVVLGILGKMEEGIGTFYAFSTRMSQGIFLNLGFEECSALARLITSGAVLSLKARAGDDLMRRAQMMLSSVPVTNQTDNFSFFIRNSAPTSTWPASPCT